MLVLWAIPECRGKLEFLILFYLKIPESVLTWYVVNFKAIGKYMICCDWRIQRLCSGVFFVCVCFKTLIQKGPWPHYSQNTAIIRGYFIYSFDFMLLEKGLIQSLCPFLPPSPPLPSPSPSLPLYLSLSFSLCSPFPLSLPLCLLHTTADGSFSFLMRE